MLFDRVYSDLVANKADEPFFKLILTLSSHEPFDVPVRRFTEPYLNAVNYTDNCLGEFVNELKDTGLWDNTLLILLADHAMQSYPVGVANNEPQRFHIPMLWIGGAVKQPLVVGSYGSQNDLSATLLSQLRMQSGDFLFSKDMLNPQGSKFAFYSYVNGFCMMDSTGTVIYDNDKEDVILKAGNPGLERMAKAYFQTMYIDLANR
nr:sulfatase-like hydrolase/transferase [Dysgonomonas sp. 511]